MPDQMSLPGMEESSKTYAQSVHILHSAVDNETGLLDKQQKATYDTYRKMRKHPTIALARAISMAPAVSSDWSYEADEDVPDEVVGFIRSQMEKVRLRFMIDAMEGGTDFGWAPFEKVFGPVVHDGKRHIGIKSLKRLLVDITDIMVDNESGDWVGFRQDPTASSQRAETSYIHLWRDDAAMLINFRVECQNHYGEALLENVRENWDDWKRANLAAQRFDRKIAGDHWVVSFPNGRSKLNGVEEDNEVVAKSILNTLEASGAVAVPQKVKGRINDLQQQASGEWKVELLTATAQQGNFTTRLEYCDKLFARGMLSPERSILEGLYGTKADASTHLNLAMTIRELEHMLIVGMVNEQLVDHLLILNYGIEWVGKVRVVASPIVDARRELFERIFEAFLTNPASFITLQDQLDIDAITDTLGIPKTEEVIDSEDEEDAETADIESRIAEAIKRLYDNSRAA